MPLTQLFQDEIRGLGRDTSHTAGSSDSGRVARLAARAAKSTLPLIIESEPGGGAESLARAIHECSDRKARAFLRLQGRRTETSDPSVFGFGAGPGRRPAVDANGGTLLIENVEQLTREEQAMLLRMLQGGEYAQSGIARPVRVDLRIMATSSANLMDLVRRGTFREDLYYRLNVLPIILPPLRARRESIPDLARRFLRHFAAEEGRNVTGLSEDALTLLIRYDWPGNVRQLENALFRAVVLAESPLLTVAEFPQIAAQVEGFEVRIPPAPTNRAATLAPEVVRVEMRDPNSLSLIDGSGELRTLNALEAEIIRFALDHYRGHMSAISRRLGIGRSTLYRKLKELGLENLPTNAAA
jgi:DNA-binding NtrC family response regulator